MRGITKFLYINLLKPILFLFPADSVHELFLSVGRKLGKYLSIKKFFKIIWAYESETLQQNICGMDFKNPIGLSAGFDYNADLVEILPSIGFGFHSIGTLTHEPYVGNKAPMLERLPKSKSLLVNKGFKNQGINKVLSSLNKNTSGAPRGLSIGATNKSYPNFEIMLQDLLAGFREAENIKYFDFYELNISCPNLLNQQNLKDQLANPSGLRQALESLQGLSLSRPVFIKMPLERTLDEIEKLMQIAKDFTFIKGLIFSNLAKDRTNKVFDKEEIERASPGNFSGKPVEEKSNQVLRFAYKTYSDRFVLIGSGGVFTAQDAYKKILLGASLVQLITGIIFMGPQQVGIINKELESLLKKDGFNNIKDAIGAQA